ncbi:MAG: hypothetical protein AAF772_19400, partial [Acidobacteriota bacterium]
AAAAAGRDAGSDAAYADAAGAGDCPVGSWTRATDLPKPLGAAEINRDISQVIVAEAGAGWPWLDYDPAIVAVGETLSSAFPNGPCGDHLEGQAIIPADPNNRLLRSDVWLAIDRVEDAGLSGRSWPGGRCAYRIGPAEPRAGVTIGERTVIDDAVPPFNELTHVLRDGAMVWLALQFNGYRSEFPAGGNKLVALDLCTGDVRWQSDDYVASGPVLLAGPYLIATEGFTEEPDRLRVYDRATGAVVQTLDLPSRAEEIALTPEKLYALTYNSLVTFPVVTAIDDLPAPAVDQVLY